MKARYILRGLGLGLIVAAVVMGAYTRSAVADARAAADAQEETETQETETLAALGTEAAETSGQVVEWDEALESQIRSVLDEAQEAQEGQTQTDEEAVSELESVSETESVSEPESAEEEVSAQEEEQEQVETVTVLISKGDDSGSVSRKLYSAGLVENASEYDAFLMQHGYDKKISTGTKEIPVDASWLEIAELLIR